MAQKRQTPAPVDGKLCPINREDFMASGEREIEIAGVTFNVDPYAFSTGSYGYYINGKVRMEIDGVKVEFQCGCNLTAINSKKMP
jgi:hypothetical protein